MHETIEKIELTIKKTSALQPLYILLLITGWLPCMCYLLKIEDWRLWFFTTLFVAVFVSTMGIAIHLWKKRPDLLRSVTNTHVISIHPRSGNPSDSS